MAYSIPYITFHGINGEFTAKDPMHFREWNMGKGVIAIYKCSPNKQFILSY